jgi:small subunit ribosomal protein S1
LEEDPWQKFFGKTRIGDVIHGKVSRQVTFGVFVELAEGIEGLCHVSELEGAHGSGGNAKIEVGSEHEFRVIRLSPGDRKIALSMKAPAPPPPPPEPVAPKAKEPEGLSAMAQALSSAGITMN